MGPVLGAHEDVDAHVEDSGAHGRGLLLRDGLLCHAHFEADLVDGV